MQQIPFMTKTFHKVIMLRAQLKNKSILNLEITRTGLIIKRTQNLCTNLLKESKQNYFGQLDMKYLNDDRKF